MRVRTGEDVKQDAIKSVRLCGRAGIGWHDYAIAFGQAGPGPFMPSARFQEFLSDGDLSFEIHQNAVVVLSGGES